MKENNKLIDINADKYYGEFSKGNYNDHSKLIHSKEILKNELEKKIDRSIKISPSINNRSSNKKKYRQ